MGSLWDGHLYLKSPDAFSSGVTITICVQASGEAKYTGSYGYGASLHAYPVLSKRALATVESLDASVALQVATSEHAIPE